MSKLLKEYGAPYIIETLQPYLFDRRLERIEAVLAQRLPSIHLACENPSDLHNGLAIIRTAEAFGVTNMHLIKPNLRAKRVGHATTKGSIKWSQIRRYESSNCFLESHRDSGRILLGASLDGEVSLQEVPVDKPLCIVFGNERDGLTEEMLDACDVRYRIPMFGFVESFNISASAAITLHELTARRRQYLRGEKDLDGQALEYEKALYFIRALGPAKAHLYLRGKASLV
jgi:tRNA (guanosine-2'-O-)-methyltransferase